MKNKKRFVHLVITDKGWIIERMASKLASNLSYVSYGTKEDPEAYVQYHMTYARFRKRVSPIEMGLFTHIEDFVPNTTDRFFKIANQLDICVCMSDKYADVLKENSESEIHMISPGIDIDQYSANIRVGVVGRTYWTGRKGEQVVNKLISIPNVDWYFTGKGWPNASISLNDEEMPNFYRQMDYILVPSYYEGGPLCVPEALAVGTQVIAPDVGWCKDFPCIFYQVGNWQQLKEILSDLSLERLKRKQSVESYTWDNFIINHDELFKNVFSKTEIDLNSNIGSKQSVNKLPSKSTALKSKKPVVGLLMHGEKNSGGGPSTRIPILANILTDYGFEVFLTSANNFANVGDVELLHIFNNWPPNKVKNIIRTIKLQNPEIKIVFSPIYLDLAHHWLWGGWLRNYVVDSDLLKCEQYKDFFHLLSSFEVNETRWLQLPQENYLEDVNWCLNEVDHIICLSACEKRRLLMDFDNLPPIEIIPNVVVSEEVSEQYFLDRSYEIDGEFILVIGRIEARKNQLALALALEGSNIKLVSVGKASDEEYERVIIHVLGDNYLPLGRINDRGIINELCRKANIVCFPSWTEGMSLALLEAIIAGAKRIITTSKNGEDEYLGDLVEYIDPWDINSISKAINSDLDHSIQLNEKIIKRLTDWQAHAENTIGVYKNVL